LALRAALSSVANMPIFMSINELPQIRHSAIKRSQEEAECLWFCMKCNSIRT
jgi:hypothetical protein